MSETLAWQEGKEDIMGDGREGAIYLTRLHLNPFSSEASRCLRKGNSQILHGTIMGMVPDQFTTHSKARILYRLETGPGASVLLIQSWAPLDLDRLPIGFAKDVDSRDIRPLLEWISEGRGVRYRLDVQPVRNSAPRMDQSGKLIRGKRQPVYGKDAIEWWNEKSEKIGLKLDPNSLIQTPQLSIDGWKDHPSIPGKRLHVRGHKTRFEGVAEIGDSNSLRGAITSGIGKGRAYGCGLLSIAAIQYG